MNLVASCRGILFARRKLLFSLLGESAHEGAKCHDKVAVSDLRDAAETFLSTR